MIEVEKKIDISPEILQSDIIKTMNKPFYKINYDERYGIIEYNNKTYIVDGDDFENIINYKKRFTFTNDDDDYPSYNINERSVNYIEHLYKLKMCYTNFTFKNGNKYDLRKNNVSTTFNILTKDSIVSPDKIFNKLLEEKQYKILEIITNGHIPTMGPCAGQYKNPIYKCLTDKNEEQLIMYCEKSTLCIICQDSLNKILEFEIKHNEGKKLVFYKHSNGYILCSHINLFIHQIITDCYGNGKGTKIISVDHKDQDPLNNTWDNLSIATREEQEQNCNGIKEGTKRARNKNAKELPDGITHDMLPKYVIYYKECYNKEKDLYREFFKIEKHPKLGKIWMTSKSNKVTILEKLNQAIKIIKDLEDNIQPEEKRTLPLYISIINFRNKPHLVYDKRGDDEKRLNLKMVLPEDYDLEIELVRFNEKIAEKYPEK